MLRQKQKPTLNYSQNSVKIGFIDKDEYIKITGYEISVVYHTHFGDCKKTRKNNKIYNLKYKNIIKNDTYINKNSKINTLKNSLNKTL